MNNTNATISLTMHVSQGEERSITSYEAHALFLEKEGKFFLFFNEENEDDNMVTKCRFELDNDAVRMRRNGPIVIEQRHLRDQKTDGYIKTPFGHLDTKLWTFQYAFTGQTNGHYELNLGYDLYTEAEKTGTYLLNITILKKEEIIS